MPSNSKPRPAKPAASSANKAYLTLYNAVSCGLWATILYRTITIVGTEGNYGALFGETGEFVKWAQSAAMMEIVHSLLGESFLFWLGGLGCGEESSVARDGRAGMATVGELRLSKGGRLETMRVRVTEPPAKPREK
jgi:hypothetical protein